jgi:hypothetical protein
LTNNRANRVGTLAPALGTLAHDLLGAALIGAHWRSFFPGNNRNPNAYPLAELPVAGPRSIVSRLPYTHSQVQTTKSAKELRRRNRVRFI